MPSTRIHLITTSSPDDVQELTRRIDAGEIDREKVVAVMGKTEGNGCVNEYGLHHWLFTFPLRTCER